MNYIPGQRHPLECHCQEWAFSEVTSLALLEAFAEDLLDDLLAGVPSPMLLVDLLGLRSAMFDRAVRTAA